MEKNEETNQQVDATSSNNKQAETSKSSNTSNSFPVFKAPLPVNCNYNK